MLAEHFASNRPPECAIKTLWRSKVRGAPNRLVNAEILAATLHIRHYVACRFIAIFHRTGLPSSDHRVDFGLDKIDRYIIVIDTSFACWVRGGSATKRIVINERLHEAGILQAANYERGEVSLGRHVGWLEEVASVYIPRYISYDYKISLHHDHKDKNLAHP
jgi:hypothetical protein